MKELEDYKKGQDAVLIDIDEIMYDELAEQIWAGNVIPVIGDGFAVKGMSVMESLVSEIAKAAKLSKIPQTLTELYYSREMDDYRPGMYKIVSSFINRKQDEYEPSDLLVKFLSIEQFPFVITTSFDYTIEKTMKDIWGKRGREVNSLVFSKDSPKNCDINGDSDTRKPTVFYMFGRADNGREHSYVLTDEDMLMFCQAWLSEDYHPSLLAKVLAGKYLLFLGVDYPDWLIRFVWYSMRNNIRKSGLHVGSRNIESSLEEFFRRVSIRIKTDPERVYQEIAERLNVKKRECEATKFNKVQLNTDFFISYSRSDRKWADVLYERLTAMGYNVWYDKSSINCGNEWSDSIRRGIRTTDCVIVLLSESILNETADGAPHPYRNEWEQALSNAMGRRNFIKPVCVGGIDFYKELDALQTKVSGVDNGRLENIKLIRELSRIDSCAWNDADNTDGVITVLCY